MTFNEFLHSRKITSAEMARLIGGCTEHAVRKWRGGERRPGADKILRIEQVTGGQVTLRDWFKASPHTDRAVA